MFTHGAFVFTYPLNSTHVIASVWAFVVLTLCLYYFSRSRDWLKPVVCLVAGTPFFYLALLLKINEEKIGQRYYFDMGVALGHLGLALVAAAIWAYVLIRNALRRKAVRS